jgi:hypothetical protein
VGGDGHFQDNCGWEVKKKIQWSGGGLPQEEVTILSLKTTSYFLSSLLSHELRAEGRLVTHQYTVSAP